MYSLTSCIKKKTRKCIKNTSICHAITVSFLSEAYFRGKIVIVKKWCRCSWVLLVSLSIWISSRNYVWETSFIYFLNYSYFKGWVYLLWFFEFQLVSLKLERNGVEFQVVLLGRLKFFVCYLVIFYYCCVVPIKLLVIISHCILAY